MRRPRDLSLLGYALLGLLQQDERSGYDLRKLFALKPLGSFSDSPGAIYPALGRLQEQGLIRGRVEERNALRRRRVFSLTEAGMSQLKKWLSQPVTQDEVVRGMDQFILRFAFSEEVLGLAAAIQLLESLRTQLKAYVPALRQYLKCHCQDMTVSGRLALESGIVGYEAQLRWSRKALTAYQPEKRGTL